MQLLIQRIKLQLDLIAFLDLNTINFNRLYSFLVDLNENNFQYVNDGARSISHETNIQSFLIDKFRFRKAYCKLHIIYSKPINILIQILFPLSSLLRCFDFGPLVKINILLYQESIRRSYEKRD